jgi:hypothetical protein
MFTRKPNISHLGFACVGEIDDGDEGYTELFLHSDTGLRRARQIISQMIREEKQSSIKAV